MNYNEAITVDMIDYTGQGSKIPDWTGRLLAYIKNTRLTQGKETRQKFIDMGEEELQEELLYVSRSIRSAWEFVSFTFEVKGVTRACATQMTRTRHASFAQAAMRVVDMSGDAFKVTIPETVLQDPAALAVWDKTVANIGEAYETLTMMGIPNQDARGILPLHTQTSLIAKYDLRCLADIVAKRKNLRVQGEYTRVVDLMVEHVLRECPWAEVFLFPERLNTPELDEILKDALGLSGPLDKPKVNEALKELDSLKATWG